MVHLYARLSLNSYAGGMAVARAYDFEVDFVRNLISGSAALFLVNILKIIFISIYGIKIYEKKFLDTEQFHFRSPDFINQPILK